MKRSELIGKTFSYLTVLSYFLKGKYLYCNCVCICGTEKVVARSALMCNHTKSCGCLTKKLMSDAKKTHGLTNHPVFTLWRSMINRCFYKSDLVDSNYKNYGGQGVRVCDEWRNDFLPFYNWCMSNGWRKGLQLDKDIIGDGSSYSPDNCMFVTGKVNSRNKSNNRFLSFNGETKCVSEWVEILGIKRTTLMERLLRGYSVEEAFTMPIQSPKDKRKPKLRGNRGE